MTTPCYLTMKEVATRAGVGLSTVKRAVKARRLKFGTVGGGRQRVARRFTPEQVDAWVQGRRAA